MKKIASIVIISTVIMLSSCASVFQSDDYLGFSKQKFTVVDQYDTHGWFGDGSFYLILDCSNNVDDALAIVDNWNSLPLSENLKLIMYGGVKDGTNYSFNLSEEAHMPAIENGFYYFEDRHTGAKDIFDDSELFNRYSFNFTLAVYDIDTNRFYYFEFDT